MKATLLKKYGKAIVRWAYVLRYHHKRQLARRLMALPRRRWLALTHGGRLARLPAKPLRHRPNPGFARILARKFALHDAQARAQAAALLEGRFCLQNVEHSLPDPVDW